MAEPGGVAAMSVAEQLRQTMARRRRRRHVMLAGLVVCTSVPLLASTLWDPPTLLVWNASSSAPVGLYRVHAGRPVRRGDMVVAWTPEPARTLAARRRYLPANVPLVKRVAAVSGDRVCAAGSAILINGVPVALRKASDPAGRPLPWWNGCRLLRSHEYILVMDSALSFDGRYFGVTVSGDILGRAELLWAKPATGLNHG